MSQRLKVLQLQPDYNVKAYDFADLAEQIVKALPADRYDVTAAFMRGKPDSGGAVSRADRSVYFEFPEKSLKGLRLRAMWRLFWFCRKEQFDVVICNRFKPVNMMLQLNRWLKIPLCIGISHGFGEYDRFYRRRQAQGRIDKHWRFVGVSPAVKQYLIDCDCGFTDENTYAITNAIDIEQAEGLQYAREQARQLLGLDPSVRLVGALGRLVPVKGHTYLLQAFAALKDKYPNAQLAIIGAGREESRLRCEIEQLGLIGRAHLLGFRENALQYVRAFDIWTMPSLAEGLGLALLEGMSGHLPVIASSVPAMLPLIHGAGGLAVEPANVPALKAALDEYLSLSDEVLQAKGEQAYRYLLAQHDIDVFRQEYLALIETGLGLAQKGGL
ncbi:glycosyltransferase [Pseudomonas sp. MH9.2]|uniref:glycosyltransferase n=1 Tax=unclassified Pseudomonas TaxID=196821 RepID=UPI002AC9571F|nr:MULTISPECIES: glycosyltransferase [unclassified Pseudomonas]MEB0007788.1 glycosyltransferase [Pseudomonas sp. RTB2]MEB0019644.1 glycosyltransferase [Pseudomonas sp. RTB3]MEB0028029.1 glycosyltransferase [Pseudomonas sp. MH9.2]MEB0150285.1 glycosyltransferase [Pseudomonas sp. CCC2.2]MEB0271886.1 glycosyltransferase [Pseudomonas sp. 5B4]